MDIEKLITCVFRRPVLWNQAHPDHQNRFIISKLWSEIAAEMNLNKNAVQKKWKYLRDYFRNENTKMRPGKSGDAPQMKFAPSWPYYRQMLFIQDQLRNRSSGDSEAEAQPQHKYQQEDQHEQQQMTEIEEEEAEAENVIGEEKQYAIEPGVVLSNRVRKRPNEMIMESLLKIEKEKLECLKEKKAKVDHETNEDMLFFQSLMPHISKIPPEMKIPFRNKVSEIVQEFAYECTSVKQ